MINHLPFNFGFKCVGKFPKATFGMLFISLFVELLMPQYVWWSSGNRLKMINNLSNWNRWWSFKINEIENTQPCSAGFYSFFVSCRLIQLVTKAWLIVCLHSLVKFLLRWIMSKWLYYELALTIWASNDPQAKASILAIVAIRASGFQLKGKSVDVQDVKHMLAHCSNDRSLANSALE